MKNCPFCGGNDLELQHGMLEQYGMPVNIVCSSCGATGPSIFASANSSDKEKMAVAGGEWDKRNQPKKAPESEENFDQALFQRVDLQQRVDDAIAGLGEKSIVCYSAYKTDKNGMPLDDLDECPTNVTKEGGPYQVIVREDDFFGNGHKYVSDKLYDQPTWLDLAIETNRSIPVTGDRHHIFFEDIQVKGSIIYLFFGS